jgi:hypothetical protein
LNEFLAKLNTRSAPPNSQQRNPIPGTPDLYGARRYSANLNTSNHIGTIQSIGHTSRSLDRIAA